MKVYALKEVDKNGENDVFSTLRLKTQVAVLTEHAALGAPWLLPASPRVHTAGDGWASRCP